MKKILMWAQATIFLTVGQVFCFDDKDTLTFDHIEFTLSYSSKTKALTFNVDGGSVTLKKFTATTFQVNNDIYKLSGSNFKKQ